MFDYLTTRRFIVPLGLYRKEEIQLSSFSEEDDRRKKSTFKSAKDEEKDVKEIKYVVTNPSKELKLRKDDLVFVLAQADPGDPNKWDDY